MVPQFHNRIAHNKTVLYYGHHPYTGNYGGVYFKHGINANGSSAVFPSSGSPPAPTPILMRNMSHFADDATQPSPFASLLSPITGSVTSGLASELPSQQQIITDYLGAVVAFWIIGGITLYAVNKLSK
jgi:hypothetical protein